MDEAILRAINAAARSPAIAAAGAFFSSRWILLLVSAALLFVLLRRRRMIAVLSIALALGVSDLVSSSVLKPMVARERPCRAIQQVHAPSGCGPGRSFPSSHAANAFAITSAAGGLVARSWIALVPLAVMVSGSRVLLGVHYPSDVLAGAVLGALIGLGAAGAGRRLERRYGSRGVRDPSPVPGSSPEETS